MTLFFRMVLYFFFSSLGTISWLAWDPGSGILSVHADGLAQAAVGYLAFIGTFIWSRAVKRRGGDT